MGMGVMLRYLRAFAFAYEYGALEVQMVASGELESAEFGEKQFDGRMGSR